jgi:hypothetical protein
MFYLDKTVATGVLHDFTLSIPMNARNILNGSETYPETLPIHHPSTPSHVSECYVTYTA